ncbi:MAG: SDR family NAD(P)-dependent oxidoreductase [Proteobacteria bacterium]|nr:SDR family NAD(P)-dependent oxidoreductase [Pseudomonadota bacterium]
MATVLITGANRGIGLEFTRQLLARGERVVAAYRAVDGATDLQQLVKANPQLTLLQLDVADNESIAAFPKQLQGEPVDIFINNVGVYGPRDSEFGKVSGKEWLDVLQINSVAPLLLTQVLIECLRKGKDRKLLYLTSKMGSIADNGDGGHYVYRSSSISRIKAISL